MTIRVRGDVVRLDNLDFARLLDDVDLSDHPELLDVPGVPEGLAAARSPLAEVDVLVWGPARASHHHAWLQERAAVFLLSVDDRERQLLALPPAHVPSGVARTVRLNPRRVPEAEPVPVPPELLEWASDGEAPDRRDAFAALGAQSAWSVTASWAGGERRLVVLDREDAWWLVLPDDDGARWWRAPVSSTELWQALSSILPSGAEL